MHTCIHTYIQLTSTMERLAYGWATKLSIKTNESFSVTDIIKYLTGILQGDCLSLILFVLCVNPLSHLLNKPCDGYRIGTPRTTKINHLLFVDDLKTYAPNIAIAKEQLKLISQFTNDIGMRFGVDKCAYMYIEYGKRKSTGTELEMDGLKISELQDTDSYKYLGADEDVAYRGTLNIDRVVKEYIKRIRKIWKSELSAQNKVIAHNSFAVPILTPTFGILDWNKDEVEAIDIKTRKILATTGNFHRNSSVDRLYMTREDGGRGLNSVYDVFIPRLISLVDHLKSASPGHKYLNLVLQHEETRSVRVSNSLMSAICLNETTTHKDKTKTYIKDTHQETFVKKAQHGLVYRKQKAITDYSKENSNSWLKCDGVTSHCEGYIFAIQEQEIYTRALKAKREFPTNPTFNKTCRYCHPHTEDIFHLLCSCEKLSASLYLPVRHNEVCKLIYNALIKLHHPEQRYQIPTPIWSSESLEIWWDILIKTIPKIPHNRPDIVVWRKTEKA